MLVLTAYSIIQLETSSRIEKSASQSSATLKKGTNPGCGALAFLLLGTGLNTLSTAGDAVSNRPTAPHTIELDLAASRWVSCKFLFLSDNQHRFGCHGMHVPGAWSTWHSLFNFITLVFKVRITQLEVGKNCFSIQTRMRAAFTRIEKGIER